MKLKYLVCAFLLILGCNLIAQVPGSIMEARVELERRGISEEEVREKLLSRGYDPDQITPEQLPKYSIVLQEIIAEIEQQKLKSDPKPSSETSPSSDKIVHVENINLGDPKPNTSSLVKTIPEKKENKIKSGIYGHQIFENSDLSVYQSDNIGVPDSYILSTGDKIIVSIFGTSQADFEFEVNKAGYINTANVGKIFVKGLSISNARELIRKRFAQRYRFLPEQFSMVLNTTRQITLNILGEVKSPGSYRINANNSGLNALMAAGGVTSVGSVRNIKLVKGNGETKILDVYEYLNDPKVQFDFPIDDQDILFVPLAQNIVTLQGAVRRPMKYEVRASDSVKDLLEYGGGLLPNANTSMLNVTRVLGGATEVLDISTNASFILKDGDVVDVKQGVKSTEFLVKVRGAVTFPGEYEYRNGMTLADLISKVVLTSYTRQDLAFIFRKKMDGTVTLEKIDLKDAKDIELNNGDEVSFFSYKDFADRTKTVSIIGAVRNPDTLTFNPTNKIKLADLILLSGGLKPNASPEAIVRRRNPVNSQEKIYKRVNVYKAIEDISSKDNILLQEGDVIQVYSNERYNALGEVAIVGEVINPDTVQYDQSLSLRGLILLAGGLKENANNTAIIKRKAADNNVEVEYIRIDLEDVLNREDVELQKGDVVRVYDKGRYMNKFDVKIYGEVKNPGSFDFDEKLTIKDLVYMAGGLTLKAATNKVEIYRVNFNENNPSNILVKEISLKRKSSDEVIPSEEINLEPYDIIIIRPIADFDLQEIVYLNGEVKYPGPYVLSRKDERLKDLIERAGGLRYRAFSGGATLLRRRGDKAGNIFVKLNEAMKGSRRENIVMRGGDILFVPKQENVVSINTRGTRANREYADSTLIDNKIQFAYQGQHSAKWYIDNFAGGFDDNVDKRSLRVIEPGGSIRGTKRYLGFIYEYPSVIEGSTIAVDYKKVKPEKEGSKTDWGKALTDTMAIVGTTVTTVVSIVVLINQLKKD